MATMVFSAVGSAAGSASGLPFGAMLGRTLGTMIGSAIGSEQRSVREGARLADLVVQTSSYGKTIPLVAGSMRLAGNVVWAMPLKELATTTTTRQGGKGGGAGRSSSSNTAYSYYATCAVAVCAGEIDGIDRIWADTRLLDVSEYTIRIYRGSETQTPDPSMEAVEGVGQTPAYRGMAYVVFEDFPLADFGNRIPNFSFEVRRSAQLPEIGGAPVESHIKAITLIPGSGEWVYDTRVQTRNHGATLPGGGFAIGGYSELANAHVRADRADASVALDQMAATLPNLEWVSVVVCWFGTSMDAGSCIVQPGVEYVEGGQTTPDAWAVGGFTRATAHEIGSDGDGPRYGGTPSDASVVRLLQDLRARGYQVALYPMMMMDMVGKPWRGDLTGSAANVASFFTKTNGYNAFINHYAALSAGLVDAFIIGSEMKGLTKVMGTPTGSFPAVNALKSLAATVRATLGGSVKLTYAADWSEYHHTDGGWYHLDALWADANIDAVGIDAYFPLTNSADAANDLAAVQAGWTSGEGWSWYYTDPARTTQASLSAAYAWKNISWWWNNPHTQPNGATSAWVAQAKPIWFTEIGYPSVDGACNQPNVFYDPASVVGGLPRFSRGDMDILSQRRGVRAALQQWQGSAMVEKMFFWTWDARPYPQWPDRADVWADGGLWRYGHWLQGKLGISHVGALVAELLERAGLSAGAFDVSALTVPLEGVVFSNETTAREALDVLREAYGFDLIERGGQLVARWRTDAAVRTISEEALQRPSPQDSAHVQQQFLQAQHLPSAVEVVHLSRARLYQTSLQRAVLPTVASTQLQTIALPLALSDTHATMLAQRSLYQAWLQRRRVRLRLGMAHADLEVGDRLMITRTGGDMTVRIEAISHETGMQLAVEAVEDAPELHDARTVQGQIEIPGSVSPTVPAATALVLADLPALPGDAPTAASLLVAMAGAQTGWRGAELLQEIASGEDYASLLRTDQSAIIGTALTALPNARATVWDHASDVVVLLRGAATLASATEAGVLAGANAAWLGGELIQFTTATALGGGQYRLSGLLRGRQGTEDAITTHTAGEAFVLLNGTTRRMPLTTADVGQSRNYRAVTFGGRVADVSPIAFTYTGRALRPYAPAHVVADWQVASGNILIRWVRRTRLEGEWRDGADVPLSEETERYRLEIRNAGGTVLRSIECTTPEWSYVPAQIATDYGTATPSRLYLRVVQLSALVGEGIARVASPYVFYSY